MSSWNHVMFIEPGTMGMVIISVGVLEFVRRQETASCQGEGYPAIVHQSKEIKCWQWHTAIQASCLFILRVSSDIQTSYMGKPMKSYREAMWVLWFSDTHFTGVWPITQRVMERLQLIPVGSTQHQLCTTFMQQPGTLCSTNGGGGVTVIWII